MLYPKATGALRRLRQSAPEEDLGSEALRPNPAPAYRPHRQSMVPENELVGSVDEIFQWCDEHEVGNVIMHAHWVAIGRWSVSATVKRAARVLSAREAARIDSRVPPERTGLDAFETGMATNAAAEWEAAGKPHFIEALHSAQVLVAAARRKASKGQRSH